MSAKWSKRPALRFGERVTVVWNSKTSHERVFAIGSGRQRRVISLLTLVHLRREDEGLTWARGWIGHDVDALKVVAALGPA